MGLLGVSFLFATFDVRAEGKGVGSVLREGTQALFSPVQRLTTAVTRPVVGFIDGIADVSSLRDENDRLSSRVAELESVVRDAEELARRLIELEKINDLDPPGELAAITARIWSNGTSDFDQVRFIDRGSDHGVVKGHPVIDDNGLVGRVDLLGEKWARVRLITDPRLGIGVRDLATNETGWVSGQGTRPLKLEMFDAGESVAAGDPHRYGRQPLPARYHRRHRSRRRRVPSRFLARDRGRAGDRHLPARLCQGTRRVVSARGSGCGGRRPRE